MIKYGFLIEDGKIYDTKIQSYKLKKEFIDNNLIFYLKSSGYKRLYLFEPLLDVFPLNKVFSLLNFNTFLKRERELEINRLNKTHYASNMAMIYNYPPTYLTNKKFSIYKICQKLKEKLD